MTDQTSSELPSIGTDYETALRRRLRYMKTAATGLLVLMAATFVASAYYAPAVPWFAYVKAFSEAAMIGALADWFAVTALFKHPMGLPIPHTAIIPRRKDELGDALARFVREHFLVPEALAPKLVSVDFAGRAADWLSREGNPEKLSRDLSGFIVWLVDISENRALRSFMRENLHMTLAGLKVAPLIGRVLELLMTGERYQKLVDAAVRAALTQVDENKFRLRIKIAAESPWWVPKFIDEEIYDKIVNEVDETLRRVGGDEHHPARKRFNESAAELITALQNDPELIAKGEAIKNELLNQPAVQEYLDDVWYRLHLHLEREAGNPESEVRIRLTKGIAGFGTALAENPDMRVQINAWIRDALQYLVEHYKEDISSVISETFERWDAQEAARRVELTVGPDLQYIRINGTLVGGLAGLLIHIGARALGLQPPI